MTGRGCRTSGASGASGDRGSATRPGWRPTRRVRTGSSASAAPSHIGDGERVLVLLSVLDDVRPHLPDAHVERGPGVALLLPQAATPSCQLQVLHPALQVRVQIPGNVGGPRWQRGDGDV